jgi:hypothetical protein
MSKRTSSTLGVPEKFPLFGHFLQYPSLAEFVISLADCDLPGGSSARRNAGHLFPDRSYSYMLNPQRMYAALKVKEASGLTPLAATIQNYSATTFAAFATAPHFSVSLLM